MTAVCFCFQVKADVQQVGNELIVSGLESAMSLIQTARNLLNAVVLTVKSAYIASTKVILLIYIVVCLRSFFTSSFLVMFTKFFCIWLAGEKESWRIFIKI